MSPEKDKVALVVQRRHLSSLELGHMGEQGREHSSDRVSQTSVEVVEDQLGFV